VLEGNILTEIEELSFSTSGTVGEICVVLGDRVKAGDPLIRLDTTMLQTRRDALADQLEHARTMDDFTTTEAALTTRMLALQYGEDSARCQLYVNEQNQAAQNRAAQIASLEDQLAEAEDNLNVQSVVTAPCDGTVAAVNVNVGDVVWPNAVVAVVADDSTCYLQTEFMNESVAAAASEIYATIGGTRYEVEYVPIETSDYITKVLSGVTMYSTFEVEGGTSDLVGQYAMLYLMTTQLEQVLNIPANALLRDAEGYYVYVDEAGVKTRRAVEIGVLTAAQAEILSGLEEGESVYVVG